MLTWGISALSHDAALAVVRDDELVFAAHAERYSRIKNDPLLHPQLLDEAGRYGQPDRIVWYERPWVKKVRHVRAGQWAHAFSRADVPGRYLRHVLPGGRLPDLTVVGHHTAHAMAGIQTSGFSDAAVVVADAIGEFDTFTIWSYSAGSLEILYRCRYPHSLGLLYSAFTRRCGFRPNEDEYITMGMAAFGEPKYVDHLLNDLLVLSPPGFRLRRNLHRGIGDWLPDARVEDLAASVQHLTEKIMVDATQWAAERTGSRNLILMGGVALNCVANSKIATSTKFDNVWIFPNPGDAGSSVGAAAAVLNTPLRWPGPYLGTDIDRALDVDAVVQTLLRDGIVGVANGRAEFGPRALGNRSILADPRLPSMKDRVNQVKGREKFRPFAPVVRAEIADEVFEMPQSSSPYMQFTAQCREPDRWPAIVHVDGSSRVQTVTAAQHPGLYHILTAWEEASGCSVLLNTSLNSRGEPLINTWEEALVFAAREQIRVL
jgi:carbamoyltransferase